MASSCSDTVSTNACCLQAMWQSAWLAHNKPYTPTATNSSSSSDSSSHASLSQLEQHDMHLQLPERQHAASTDGMQAEPVSLLAEADSVHALREQFPSFMQQAERQGYKLGQVSVHSGKVRVRV
jgi:hypothetical protein